MGRLRGAVGRIDLRAGGLCVGRLEARTGAGIDSKEALLTLGGQVAAEDLLTV